MPRLILWNSVARVCRSAISVARWRPIDKHALSIVSNGPDHFGFSPVKPGTVRATYQPWSRTSALKADKAYVNLSGLAVTGAGFSAGWFLPLLGGATVRCAALLVSRCGGLCMGFSVLLPEHVAELRRRAGLNTDGPEHIMTWSTALAATGGASEMAS